MKALNFFAGVFVLVVFLVTSSQALASTDSTDIHKKIITELESRIAEMEDLLKRHGLSIEVGNRAFAKKVEMAQNIKKEVVEEESTLKPSLDTPTDTPENVPPTESVTAFHQVTECLRIGRIMRFGEYREDITKLQEFLKTRGHFSHPHITWYYGPVTERAVQAFQSAEGIVSHGTHQTTGFGQIGPMTARAIERITCGTQNIGSDI